MTYQLPYKHKVRVKNGNPDRKENADKAYFN
jgi:hypothetical protein